MAGLQCERSVVNSPAQQFLGQNLWMFSLYAVNSISTDRNFCFWSRMSAWFFSISKTAHLIFVKTRKKVSAKQVANKNSLVLEESSWIGHTHLVNGLHRVFIIKAVYNVPPIHTQRHRFQRDVFWQKGLCCNALSQHWTWWACHDRWLTGALKDTGTQATPSYNPELPAALDWMDAFIRGLSSLGFHAVWKRPLISQKYYMENRLWSNLRQESSHASTESVFIIDH